MFSDKDAAGDFVEVKIWCAWNANELAINKCSVWEWWWRSWGSDLYVQLVQERISWYPRTVSFCSHTPVKLSITIISRCQHRNYTKKRNLLMQKPDKSRCCSHEKERILGHDELIANTIRRFKQTYTPKNDVMIVKQIIRQIRVLLLHCFISENVFNNL